MTPRQENSIERAVGRIEAHQEAMAENLSRLVDQFAAANATVQEMKSDVAELKRRADLWSIITDRFNALENTIHDGKLAAKSGTKGFILGVTFAGGAVGATAATGIKWVVSTIWGAP